ncbi:MAG: tetratricopeptide repeat protein, partial [Methanobacterium sp.]
ELDDRQREADALLEIAQIQVEMGKLDYAYRNYETSCNLFNQINDNIGTGYSLSGLGMIAEGNKRYEEAREYYEKSIKKFKKSKDYKRMGIVSNLIAHTYEMQDALEDALIDYERSLELFRKLKDKSRETEIFESIDRIERKRSKYKISNQNFLILIGYLAAIAAAESLTTYFDMKVGLVVETAILFVLLIHSSRVKSYNFANLLRTMMILPIVRIIGLSLPIMQIPVLYWFPIISIPLFAASFSLMRLQGLNRKKVGLVWGNIPLQLLIAFSGIFLGFIEFFILKPAPLISTFDTVPLIIASILLIISTGFAEELLFRGILQRNAENVLGSIFGLVYAALLFTSLHIGWHSFLDLAFVFGVALLYGYAFQKTRSLFGITLSHGLSNSVLFLVMPFVVINVPF